MIDAAVTGDLSELDQLMAVLSTPFEEPDDPRFLASPNPDQRVYQTFCGT